MSIIRAIRLQRKLRIRQEVLFDHVVKWTWQRPYPRGVSPYFNEFRSVNKAVSKVNSMLPALYFVLSDMFGGSRSMWKASKDQIAAYRTVTRLERRGRTDIDIKSSGSGMDLFDNQIKLLWRINDNEYDYLARYEQIGDYIDNMESVSTKRRALNTVNRLLEKYYDDKSKDTNKG